MTRHIPPAPSLLYRRCSDCGAILESNMGNAIRRWTTTNKGPMCADREECERRKKLRVTT